MEIIESDSLKNRLYCKKIIKKFNQKSKLYKIKAGYKRKNVFSFFIKKRKLFSKSLHIVYCGIFVITIDSKINLNKYKKMLEEFELISNVKLIIEKK